MKLRASLQLSLLRPLNCNLYFVVSCICHNGVKVNIPVLLGLIRLHLIRPNNTGSLYTEHRNLTNLLLCSTPLQPDSLNLFPMFRIFWDSIQHLFGWVSMSLCAYNYSSCFKSVTNSLIKRVLEENNLYIDFIFEVRRHTRHGKSTDKML